MTTMSAKKQLMNLLKKQKRFVLRIDQTIGIVFLGANSNRNLIHLQLKTKNSVHSIQECRGAGWSENLGVHKLLKKNVVRNR